MKKEFEVKNDLITHLKCWRYGHKWIDYNSSSMPHSLNTFGNLVVDTEERCERCNLYKHYHVMWD